MLVAGEGPVLALWALSEEKVVGELIAVPDREGEKVGPLPVAPPLLVPPPPPWGNVFDIPADASCEVDEGVVILGRGEAVRWPDCDC